MQQCALTRLPWAGHTWGVDLGWMWVWTGLAWVAAIALIVWLIMRVSGSSSSDPTERARQILSERYAEGEIDTDEYEDRLRTLR